jgi:6,7-dimethyl-8-ribityllumazine synthase
MSTVNEGILTAAGKRFGIVISRFNELITKKMLEGAMDCLVRHNAQTDLITISWVPGAFEIPIAAKRMAKSGNFDAIICIGAVIRGNTPHFDYIAAEVTKGIAAVGLTYDIPVIFGVLTTDTIDQAVERAGTKSGNKGWDAALSAIEMVDLFTKI